ncbi:hypothetical protein ACI01nite_21980 [Acetobacter cibinongensis]|uniref:Pilus assembly protein CpaD n=1 Tax=Acetobacter cibinongensis TaxID=146475 RepID=A0A0D6N0X3_9PROT|nr:CpaD family pilus assembly lipoprotein [Acetobacter cibinongensis]GAN59218.1 hypothetical protein Abci_002_095 [Acetobacter cibinongensis]GBQ19298.1 hypothetical protein AA0482_2525 [Acetobacter cibinongensis NRIC 0482]GEL59596.1 hypothetical protein ACI01nite_21980 [Acetobacter cibinongensis]
MKKTALLAFLALCSCEATQSDRVKTLPVALHTEQRTIPLSNTGLFNQTQVQQALAALGQGTEVSVDIEGLTQIQSQQLLPKLLSLGVDPDRVHVAPLTARYPVVPPRMTFSRTQAVLQNCSKVIRPGWLGDVTPSIENVGRCVQNNNLAQMLADPSDLYRSPAFHASPAERAALGVRRLNLGQEPALPADTLGTGLSGSNSVGGMTGGTTSETQTQGNAAAP